MSKCACNYGHCEFRALCADDLLAARMYVLLLLLFLAQALMDLPIDPSVEHTCVAPDTGVNVSVQVFRSMEAEKSRLKVVAYGVSMPTLEQVFLAVIGESLAQ